MAIPWITNAMNNHQEQNPIWDDDGSQQNRKEHQQREQDNGTGELCSSRRFALLHGRITRRGLEEWSGDTTGGEVMARHSMPCALLHPA